MWNNLPTTFGFWVLSCSVSLQKHWRFKVASTEPRSVNHLEFSKLLAITVGKKFLSRDGCWGQRELSITYECDPWAVYPTVCVWACVRSWATITNAHWDGIKKIPRSIWFALPLPDTRMGCGQRPSHAVTSCSRLGLGDWLFPYTSLPTKSSLCAPHPNSPPPVPAPDYK